MLRVSSDGSLAAILERKGDYGVIVDVADRTSIFELHRDGHSHHVGRFPIAFIERAGRQLIAFSPEWNRLDIVDPRTGEIVTPHASPPHESAHDLDYVHCGLLVSPDERWILDAGWVWHPVGIPTTWSMDAWFENPHEYIDGPTRRELCWRHYEWDTPACWIEDGRLALSGFGADEAWLIPAARIFDVVTGLEQRWFPGPTGDFVFDRELFAVGSAGTTVWNVARGTRLHTEPASSRRTITPTRSASSRSPTAPSPSFVARAHTG
jgi:hypothetical protein